MPPVDHVRVLVVNVLPDRTEDVVPLRVRGQVGLLGYEIDGGSRTKRGTRTPGRPRKAGRGGAREKHKINELRKMNTRCDI